jgi:hypothetical protein
MRSYMYGDVAVTELAKKKAQNCLQTLQIEKRMFTAGC